MLGPNLALLFTVIAWGTNIPASAVLLEHWDPWFLSVVRFAAGYLALWLLFRWREPAAGRLTMPVASWRLWLLGAAGAGLFGPVYNLGIATSNPVMVAIMNATSPAVAALVGRICFGQPIERRMFPAIALAVLGCALATWDPENTGNPFAVRGGEPLILIAMFLWSWYSLAAQRWLPGWSQMRITTATLGPGVAVIIAFYLIAGALGVARLTPGAPRDMLDVGLVLWISVGGVAFAMLFWNYGVRRLGLVVASLFLNLMPIITILVLALMGQMPTWLQLTGTALVVLGLPPGPAARPRRSQSHGLGVPERNAFFIQAQYIAPRIVLGGNSRGRSLSECWSLELRLRSASDWNRNPLPRRQNVALTGRTNLRQRTPQNGQEGRAE